MGSLISIKDISGRSILPLSYSFEEAGICFDQSSMIRISRLVNKQPTFVELFFNFVIIDNPNDRMLGIVSVCK